MTTRKIGAATFSVMLVCVVGGCGGGTDTPNSSTGPAVSSPPAASDFVDVIDNPWMPWRVGTRWSFLGKTADGTERTVVTVTDRTRVVAGVTTTVVRDVVHLDGKLLEDTDDWYAQDSDGNVWYFGEDTTEYTGTKADTSGSWEAGVDGARAGIAMPAHPAVGDHYRQEYYRGEAEDEAKVLALDASASVPYGNLSGLLQTKDYTRLEPTADEHKFYARGVGVVLEVGLHEKDRTQLVSMTTQRGE
jgi:hypothetical protein